ncbi:MAG: hypothetical protein ACK4RM_01320 [Flavobacterium sp.]
MKTIRKYVLYLFIILTSDSNIYCQCSKIGGVFYSIESYNARKYDDSLCLDNPKNKIYAGSFNRLVLKSADKNKKKYKYGEIFAYQTGNNIFIFQKQEKALDDYGFFPIMDTTGLIIYSRKESRYRGTTLRFYYSVEIGSKIKRLNLKNIKLDFDNDEFIKKISPYVSSVENNNPDKRLTAINIIQSSFNKYFR